MPLTPKKAGFQRNQYSQFKINRNGDGRNNIDVENPDELLLKDLRSCHAIINAGQEDEMSITGYCRSNLRTILSWALIILTGGLLRLLMHWWKHWLLLATHSPCSLDIAEKVLVREDYQKKHIIYYVKDVITLNLENFKKMYAKKEKWQKYIPFNEEIDEKLFKLSLHFSGGNFKHLNSIRIFHCKQLRYVWEEQTQKFQKITGLDNNIPISYLHKRQGLSKSEQYARRLVFGTNTIKIPIKDALTLLFLEVLNPYYVFQVFSVCLWISYNYYYYAIVIIITSAYGIIKSIIQTKKSQHALRNAVESSDYAMVVHDTGKVDQIETHYLVPGDLIEIPSYGCIMQCDAVLISGNCILDESMLTGESVPVTKTPLPYKGDLLFDIKEHSRHTLFSGTKIIQTRYIGSEKVLAVVINTGFITAKGGLIRSILYPPPVDYKFEQDSYKFIAILGLIAGIGFLYTLITKIMRSISAAKIAIESLDLITIAVPPALPAAMTVLRLNGQKRLKKKNIYCISPRTINVAGSIDCVCFDKTGTLTEDGLEMWGVLPKSATNSFQIPLKQIERLPCDHFLYAMVSCHSITVMNGELKGDPLDLKMFESTGWILEDPNVADGNKYDLLFPTILKPPKEQQNETNIESDDEIYISKDIGIVREFSFSSTLQRMSVITRRLCDKNFTVYCKGSPEMIQTLCKPNTVPNDYADKLNEYAQQGYRIIALAYKQLDKRITYARVQKIGRDEIERDLECLGFVILENRLKPDTAKVINSLTDANIRTVMVTGDNILTALSVAKDCGMVGDNQSIIQVNIRPNEQKNQKYEIFYNLTGVNSNINTPIGNGDVCSLITNSNSITSFETIDTWTHRDIETGINGNQNKAFEQPNLIPNIPSNNYCFAMVGKTWSIIRDYYPELLSKFVVRGTIFARMSPEQKQSLIIELQNLGYYVAMCGDGANDCGALKAAHTGISLSQAESSVASPFTSKEPTIACVPQVIKEGRSALVTLFGIFKYMAAYSIVQFVSVLMLYSIDSNLTDVEFLYIDLFLITIFVFLFSKTEAYDGPLDKRRPLSSLISLSPILSLLLHLIIAILFQISGWYHLKTQSWYVPFNFTTIENENDLGCYENYTIFILSCFQYIILAFVFSKGAPYRKSILSNYIFLISIILNTILVIYLAIIPINYVPSIFGLVVPNDYKFRTYLLLYGLGNFLVSLLIESILIDYIIFKKLRYKFHNKNKTTRKYLSIENELRQNFKWPLLSNYQGDIISSNKNDKISPVSYTEICVKSAYDINTEFDHNNSVLNKLFETMDDSIYYESDYDLTKYKNDINNIDETITTVNYNNFNYNIENYINSCAIESRNDSGIDFEMMINPSLSVTASTSNQQLYQNKINQKHKNNINAQSDRKNSLNEIVMKLNSDNDDLNHIKVELDSSSLT